MGPLLQNNVFTALNASGIVTTFDGVDVNLPAEITNDTLVIFQDILVGPDGNIDLTSTSNLNGLFDDNVLNAIKDAVSASNITLDKSLPSEIGLAINNIPKEDKKISTDNDGIEKAKKTDIDTISK